LSAMFSLSVRRPSTCKDEIRERVGPLDSSTDCSACSQRTYRPVELGHCVAAVLVHEALRAFLKLAACCSTPPVNGRPELIVLPACTREDFIGLFVCATRQQFSDSILSGPWEVTQNGFRRTSRPWHCIRFL
jgi:hypothetical protein